MEEHPNEPVRKIAEIQNSDGTLTQVYEGVRSKKRWHCVTDGVRSKWSLQP